MRSLKRKLLLERDGVASMRELEAAEQLLTTHQNCYADWLLRRGRSERYVRDRKNRLALLLKGLRSTKDLEPVELRQRLQGLQERRGLSGTTTNRYRTALHGFCQYLVEQGALRQNPVKAIRTEQARPGYHRRALTNEELKRLLEAAPAERARVYRVATLTGLRRGELKALNWSQVELEKGVLHLKADQAKNRRIAAITLTAEVVGAIAETPEARRRPDGNVFPRMPSVKALRRDLETAGIAFETAEGRVDFHALRVTFCTLLARAGVPLVQAQQLMRHSDPKLTANIYSRFDRRESRAAVEKAARLLK